MRKLMLFNVILIWSTIPLIFCMLKDSKNNWDGGLDLGEYQIPVITLFLELVVKNLVRWYYGTSSAFLV